MMELLMSSLEQQRTTPAVSIYLLLVNFIVSCEAHL